MKPVVRCLLVVAGMFTAGTAFAQDFKSQASAAAAQWDAAFNSGDIGKLSQAYTKDAVILPAGGERVTGPQGAEKVFGGFIKGGESRTIRSPSMAEMATMMRATSTGRGRPTPETRS